jgi:filamentous hemagglutinin
MLTDQFAMHHQRIADLFNVAHGFPLPGRGSAGEEPPAVLRSALGDDGTVPSTPKPKQDEPATEAPKAGDKVDEAAPLVAPGIDETAMPTVQPKADSEETTPGPQAAKATAPDTTAGVATPKKPTTGVEALQQFGIDFSAEKSRASIGRRVAEVADLLPEDHPMREALRDIGKQLSSRKRRFPDGQDPWTRLANLSLDTDFGEMIARELNRPLPKGEDEAAARRTEIRRDMSAKRNVAEETDRGGDLRALHAEELAEVAPSQRRPPNRRMREVQATPEYSLLATDMPVLARGPNGAIDPAEGQRIADTMRAFHGFDEGRNVALAELRVENASQLLISKSNNEVLPGLTTLPQDRLFATFDVNARPGDNHTESVLLEHTARVIDAGKFANNQEAAFAVSMYTERAPCESCQGVIAQFAQRYPDIAARSMVSWSGPPAGQASFLDVAAGLAP